MKEVPFRLIIKSVTIKRMLNAGLVISSYLLSAIRKKVIVWGQPFILTVEPTNVCNLKCPLCVTGNGKMTRKAGLMSFETFKTLIDEVGERIFYLLLYQQGEPFINKDFLKFVEYAKSKRIFVTTSTNGHYLNPETAQETVASGLDSIIVSIDGAEQESYETYRVDGKLSKVIGGVENLVWEKNRQKSKTPLIFIQFLVMKHNEQQIKKMEKLVKMLGADKLLKKTVQVATIQEAIQWLPKTESLRRYRFIGETFQTKQMGKGPCPRPWISTLVNWDGSVVPCCFDKNGQFTLGILTENDFAKIWNSNNYEIFRDKMLMERETLEICSNCSQGLRLYL